MRPVGTAQAGQIEHGRTQPDHDGQFDVALGQVGHRVARGRSPLGERDDGAGPLTQ